MNHIFGLDFEETNQKSFVPAPSPWGRRAGSAVYWANDLFSRRPLSMAEDMAESPGLPAVRNFRHGRSRTALSASRRTSLDSRQAWLAGFRGSAATASPRAPLHAAHSSERPRSHPDHAAARQPSPMPRNSRNATAPGSPRVSVVCRRRRRSRRERSFPCAASTTRSCIAPAAARCGPRPATAASGFSASPATPSTPTAGCTTF